MERIRRAWNSSTGCLPSQLASLPQRFFICETSPSSAMSGAFTDESTGRHGQEILYRDDEPRFFEEQGGRAWSIDSDGFDGSYAL